MTVASATTGAAAAPASSEPMRPVDCAWLRMDQPDNLMVINGVMDFAVPLEAERVRELLATRLGSIRRFRQRPVERSPRRWEWEEVPLDVDRHLVVEHLPSPAGGDALNDLVGREMSQPLPSDRPLWRVHLIHRDGAGSALLWRLHHSVGDGIALMVLLLALADLEPEGGAAGAPWSNPLAALFGESPLSYQEARRHLEEILPEGVRLMVRPWEALAAANRWLVRAACIPCFSRLAALPPDRRTRLRGELSGDKRVAWSRGLPLEGVQRAREAFGGTVNDLLLTAISGAVGRYLEAKGDRTGDGLSVRALVPVSLRPLPEMSSLGNQFGIVFLPLPVGIRDAGRRLAELRRRMRGLKGSLQPVVVLGVLGLLGRAPQRVQDLVLRLFGAKGTMVLTSVPGPAKPLYLVGQAIRSLVFWVPQSARLGVGISIISYAGEVRLGVMGDAAVLPDPEDLVAAFEEELGALLVTVPSATA